MQSFKTFINSGFSGCRHVASGRDPHRQRDVRIYAMPGIFDYVGAHDGVDSWVAPVAANPFDVNIVRLMADLQAGKDIPAPQPLEARRRLRLINSPPPQPPAQPEPRKRARLAVPAPTEQQPTLRRRNRVQA